jgi:hypothetical protein
MIRPSFVTIGLLLTALVAGEAAAQWNVARFGADPNRVYTSLGVDPSVVGAMGYARVLTIAEHPFQFSLDGSVAVGDADVRDFKTRLAVQTSVLSWRSVHLTGSLAFVTRGTENSIYRGFSFGSSATGTLGWYRRRWFAAGELGFDKSIITHVTHSDWYREHFFPDAKDAWYLDTGGTYNAGVTGGLSLGRTEVVGRFGWARTERMNALLPPMYATLGLGVAY